MTIDAPSMSPPPLRWAFFTHAHNFGDCSRAIEVARAMKATGATVRFYHRGGSFVEQITAAGLAPIALEPPVTQEQHEALMDMDQHRAPVGTLLPYTEEQLVAMVESELEVFRQFKPDGVYCGLNLSSMISVPHAHIPMVTLVPTALCPAFFHKNLASFPDAMDTKLLRWLVPRSVKKLLINRIMLGKVARKSALVFNRVRTRYGLEPIYNFTSLVRGDLTLLPDLPELSGLAREDLPPGYSYSGPLYARLELPLPAQVRRIFARPGLNVYCSMGSSGTPELLTKLVSILRSKPEYNVVCTTTNLLEPSELGPPNERFFAARFLPALEIGTLADVALTHGGQGTVQTMISAGTPVVGIGMQWEQQANLDGLQRAGAGIRLPLWGIDQRSVLDAIAMAAQPATTASVRKLQKLVRAGDGATEAVRQMNDWLLARPSYVSKARGL